MKQSLRSNSSRFFYLGFLYIVLFPIICRGQTCCSGGVPLSNNIGLPNEGKGTLQLGLNYDYNNLNTLLAGKERLNDVSRQRETQSVLLNLGYGINKNFAIETLFTWVRQTRTIEQFGNRNFTETTGVGDAIFLLKYTIENLPMAASSLNLGIGAKAPLGASDRTTEEGLQLTADLQPGSGAWDGIFWAQFLTTTGFRPSAMLSLSTSVRLTGTNSNYLNGNSAYTFGDEWQTLISYSDQFLLRNTLLAPALIFRYRRAYRDLIDGQSLPNTGGKWIFIRPELGLVISPELRLLTRFELPLYSEVDGTQLTPTSRLTFGINYVLRKKETSVLIN